MLEEKSGALNLKIKDNNDQFILQYSTNASGLIDRFRNLMYLTKEIKTRDGDTQSKITNTTNNKAPTSNPPKAGTSDDPKTKTFWQSFFPNAKKRIEKFNPPSETKMNSIERFANVIIGGIGHLTQ